MKLLECDQGLSSVYIKSELFLRIKIILTNKKKFLIFRFFYKSINDNYINGKIVHKDVEFVFIQHLLYLLTSFFGLHIYFS